MKKRILLLTSTIFVTTIAVSTFNNFDISEVHAASYEPVDVVTNINLNDTTEANIRKYYSSLSSYSSSELQGDNLLKNLKPILKNNQVYFGYDSNDDEIWKLYEIVDRDWVKSPKENISGYNAATNTISNYKYGTSTSDRGSNPYVHALYYNRDKDQNVTAWGSHQDVTYGINREHIWAKSQGFDSKGKGGARGDPMHLWPANPAANSSHSNNFFGFVNKSLSDSENLGDKRSFLNNNFSGKSLTFGNNTVFEPQDCDKGDIARAIFYMAARYNYFSGSDSDGIDQNNPNLKLVQTDNKGDSCDSTTTKAGTQGILSDLLEWHKLDPVDDYEIHRNNLLYENYTKNRNPFIDFPEWADYIWGTAEYDGERLISYDSTPTGYARPSVDAVYGHNESSGDTIIEVTSIQLSDNALTLEEGNTETLIYTILPSNATNKDVTWDSDNKEVATVSSTGVITALKEGVANISATSNSGNKTATCKVTVVPKAAIDTNTYVEDVLNNANTINGAGNTYKSWTYDSETSNAIYSGNSAGSNSSIQLRSSDNNSGIVSTTSGGTLAKVILSWNSNTSTDRIVQIYGSNKAYTSPEDLYVDGKQGTLLGSIKCGTSTTLTVTDSYKFIGIRSSSGALYLDEIKISYLTQEDDPETNKPTSITATCSKQFSVGDYITKSDIVLKDNLGNTITNYEFYDYQFTYEDAQSGGLLTPKTFNIEYDNLDTTLTVNVKREAYVEGESDTLTRTDTGMTSTSYGTWSNVSKNSPAVYAGQSAGGNSSIQLRSNNNNSGIVSTTSGGFIKKVTVTWNSNTTAGRTLNVYGSNKAYSSPEDLYGSNAGALIGTIAYNTSTEITINDSYKYVGVRSASGALYLSKITFEYGTQLSATSLSNYVMFEDTANQCETKLNKALEIFESLSSSERTTFMTSSDYVIATARTRLLAWATYKNKTIVLNNDIYIVQTLHNNIFDITSNNSNLPLVAIIASGALVILFTSIVTKRKKIN